MRNVAFIDANDQWNLFCKICDRHGWSLALRRFAMSGYEACPDYRAPLGAVGEDYGKLMCNQYVLRGGSVATSSHHVRTTYRNFVPAESRWQFSGIRLARRKKLT